MPSGSCLCGAMQYNFNETELKALCHCLTCRKVSGTTYATTIFVPESAFVSHVSRRSPDGGPVIQSLASPKTFEIKHESGMMVTLYGCPYCTTTCYKKVSGFPGKVIVFAGTLNGTDGRIGEGGIEVEGAPEVEIWTKHRVPWVQPVGLEDWTEWPEERSR